MSLIPENLICGDCLGYLGVAASMMPRQACSCAPAPEPELSREERALEVLGESLAAHAARRQRFTERGYA